MVSGKAGSSTSFSFFFSEFQWYHERLGFFCLCSSYDVCLIARLLSVTVSTTHFPVMLCPRWRELISTSYYYSPLTPKSGSFISQDPPGKCFGVLCSQAVTVAREKDGREKRKEEGWQEERGKSKYPLHSAHFPFHLDC